MKKCLIYHRPVRAHRGKSFSSSSRDHSTWMSPWGMMSTTSHLLMDDGTVFVFPHNPARWSRRRSVVGWSSRIVASLGTILWDKMLGWDKLTRDFNDASIDYWTDGQAQSRSAAECCSLIDAKFSSLEYENGKPSVHLKSPSKCLSVAPIQYDAYSL